MTTVSEPEGTPDATPDGTGKGAGRGRLGRWWWAVGLAIAAVVVVILAPLASSDPDGLERVAEDSRLHRAGAELLLGSAQRLRDPGH